MTQSEALLWFTGHPIADVGVATATAFARRSRPEEIGLTDLEKLADYMAREYFSGKLLSYLTCVFPNSAYVNPTMGADKKERYRRDILFGFRRRTSIPYLRCSFSGGPADRLAYRQHVPLVTGEDVINFFPAGLGGLPVSSAFLLAVQAFPLGALRCHGRALAVHCPDDYDLTLAFASRFLTHNLKLLQLAGKTGEKYEDAKHPRTLILHELVEIEASRKAGPDVPVGLTVYHLTNSGQGADIDLFELPSRVVGFLRTVNRAGTSAIWRRIVAAAWERSKSKEGKKAKGEGRRPTTAATTRGPGPADATGPGKTRNYVYEDLFALPGSAARFVRAYFLRKAFRRAFAEDPRRTYSIAREGELVSWEVTALFLKEVLGMEKERREAIRVLGDRIAEHVAGANDRRAFQALYRAKSPYILRNLLIKVSADRVKKGLDPLIGFDEFLIIFEEGEEAARVDWSLARDLVLIRTIEQLHQKGWFGQRPDVLEELADADDVVAAS